MYYFYYALFYVLSLLPMPVLYLIADAIFFVVYRLLKYRRKVVLQNLSAAFPQKNQQEIKTIEEKFYRNLIDSLVETFKLLSASGQFLKKRVTANWDLLEQLQQSGKSCQIHLGHTFNWEWGQHVLQMNTGFQVLVVYSPLGNKTFERLLLKMRRKFGSAFIPASHMKSSIAYYKDTQYLLGLVADQSPGKPAEAYWLNFLNRPTGFIAGPEKGARNLNLPVLFATITKPKRGYYHATLSIATENPTILEEGELTRMYTRFLEGTIISHPQNWLWSHRRWKHAYKPEYAHRWIDENTPAPSHLVTNNLLQDDERSYPPAR